MMRAYRLHTMAAHPCDTPYDESARFRPASAISPEAYERRVRTPRPRDAGGRNHWTVMEKSGEPCFRAERRQRLHQWGLVEDHGIDGAEGRLRIWCPLPSGSIVSRKAISILATLSPFGDSRLAIMNYRFEPRHWLFSGWGRETVMRLRTIVRTWLAPSDHSVARPIAIEAASW